MKLKDIKDVLTFASFRPEPDDGSALWTRRFPKRKTLLLNIGKNRTSWRCLGKGGRILDGGSQKGDFKDIATSLAADWRKLTDDGWCNVSVNSRYVVSLEGNLPRKEGIEDVMRTNPRAALGSKFERNKRYALTNNPEHSTSIVLSCDEEVIKKIEATLGESGLRAGRICCGAYTMLRRAIEHVNDGNAVTAKARADHLYVICCEGSVCILSQAGDAWSDLRSRCDFYDEDASAVLEIVTPGRRSDEQQAIEIVFAADQIGSDLPAKLSERLPDTKLTDLTQPDHLWAVISDLR
ncbi:MAG: hypothetical protein PHC88_12485 [Terrimicrobiaceae bacterium]|nr:hypothetical protein [Terrimicrobiaceae bacterium]